MTLTLTFPVVAVLLLLADIALTWIGLQRLSDTISDSLSDVRLNLKSVVNRAELEGNMADRRYKALLEIIQANNAALKILCGGPGSRDAGRLARLKQDQLDLVQAKAGETMDPASVAILLKDLESAMEEDDH